ncbi:hypothetical protein Tco_1367351 [Tanacetum coccineum]
MVSTNLFTLKVHRLLERRYTNAVVDWYHFIDSELFSINEYDSLLEDLGSTLQKGFIVEKQMMEVSLAKGKGVLIEEIVEDDDVEGTPI